MKSKRQHIGTVGIDTAMLYIGDPCYIARTPLGRTGSGYEADDKAWDEFLDGIAGPEGYLETAAAVEGTLPNGQTKFPAGMVVKTGWGDGEYDVFVTMKDGRVASVEVVFIK
jgi:hypothetical protein